MAAENQAMLLRDIKNMNLEAYPKPSCGPDDVLVAMKSVGICGSDVHYWQHGEIGDFKMTGPMVIGHESAGEVVEVGANVSNCKVGDRVALEPGVPCDNCEQCKEGKYNLCPDIRFFATPPIHGSLQRYVVHPARFSFVLPENVTTEMGAMCEPLSVGVYACEQKARVKPGQTVAVFGAGPIGTMCSLVANGMQAGKIILCDINPERLEFVASLIPGLVTINTTGLDSKAVATKIEEANGGKKVDSCIDCAGAEPVIQAAIYCTKNGGCVCLVGMGRPEMSVPLLNASCREVELQGVFRYRNTYPACIDLMATGKVDVKPLITHRFEFTQESMMEAFEACKVGKGKDGSNAIKCMINL
mmetsp:Transcript_23813/g.52459  ORF Transcript_23813/g.52459 Transcript_23813/m.52459 type:complete len:358 (+) Transcript_23813:53-1126(+)